MGRTSDGLRGLDALENEAALWEESGEEFASVSVELLRRWVREAREGAAPACENVGGERHAFECSRCGGYTTEFDQIFAPPEAQEAARVALCRALGLDPDDVVTVSAHSNVPRFCPWCGARVARHG